MSLKLLTTRRLAPLCLTQACGAFNDNLIKNAIVVMAVFGAASQGAGFAALAGALFIAPYMLLSALSGQIADRFEKQRLIIYAKCLELSLMILATLALVTGNQILTLGTLLGLGIQATIFSPLKYGIIPEHLKESELVSGNGIIEATMFLSILAGTIMGGLFVDGSRGGLIVGIIGICVSLLGLASAKLMPYGAGANPESKPDWNLIRGTYHVVKQAFSSRNVRLSILGISWFWTVGATLLAEFPELARDTLHGDSRVVTLLLTLFAAGIGMGSLACAKLTDNTPSPRLVPFAILGISLFSLDLAYTCSHIPMSFGLYGLYTTLLGWHIIADLVLLSACGGIFSVPLYALIQDASGKAERARNIAANNAVNAVFMVIGAGGVGLADHMGLSVPQTLAILTACNFAITAIIASILPHEILRGVFRFWFGVFHGVDIKGLENYRAVGDKCLIISNHLSFADAALIAAYLPDNPTFAIDVQISRRWWVRPFLALVDVFKVDSTSPYAVKHMIEAVRDTRSEFKLVIFPEGRLTVTGGMMKIYDGAGLVADKANVPMLPIAIDGLQYSYLTRLKGLIRRRPLARLSITVMPPIFTGRSKPEETSRQRRTRLGHETQNALINACMEGRIKHTNKTIYTALLDAKHTHGSKMTILEDQERILMTYKTLILASIALGQAIHRAIPNDKTLGVLVPNSRGAAVTFMALQAFAKVPAMLNVSAGLDGMLSACKTAGIKTVISSRRFVSKVRGLDAIVAKMEQEVCFIWLEDLKAQICLFEKIRAKIKSWHPKSLPGAKINPENPAVILFTSGSEGTPKGVVLTHKNIMSNIAQVSCLIDFTCRDRVFNAMPLFHSFGLTGGLLLPLLGGVKSFQYPSPLHYKIIPALVYDTDSTILFGTDTFYANWGKNAHPYDLRSIRYAFSGAEKVRETTRRLYADKFGVRLLEGYGVTETAPVLALNTPSANKPGSVGKLLPGIEWKLTSVPNIDEGGQLSVRGPNIMAGYLKASHPGILEAPKNGWYDTGDIVVIDDEGFVTIKGRAKRFAKIAGEMVSMAAAEEMACSVWPTAHHAVIALPDARKGEKLLLVTTQKDAIPKALLITAREKGTPEIMVPRDIMFVTEIPLLGTGKTDYPKVQKLVEDRQTTQSLENNME
jgi:acyl-[acyl-carrier-protein]-phospholipid O-acyltransferase / long-chain-fatty-acid--[acyl-carrier-protein] ligase